MTSKDVAKSIVKSLPIVGAMALGVGATLAIVNKDKIEDKVANKLITRQIIKEHIPLQ